MSQNIFPSNYKEWKHCITVECGIPLEHDFIDRRIAALQDHSDYYTQQFIKHYGADYLNQTLLWFSEAKRSL